MYGKHFVQIDKYNMLEFLWPWDSIFKIQRNCFCYWQKISGVAIQENEKKNISEKKFLLLAGPMKRVSTDMFDCISFLMLEVDDPLNINVPFQSCN